MNTVTVGTADPGTAPETPGALGTSLRHTANMRSRKGFHIQDSGMYPVQPYPVITAPCVQKDVVQKK